MIDETKLALCKKLYIQHGGINHKYIQSEMRAAGYERFNVRCLYRSGKRAGWIERFGWRHEVPRYVSRAALDALGFRTPDELNEYNRRRAEYRHRDAAARVARHVPRAPARRPMDEFRRWLKSATPGYTWDWSYQEVIYRHLERVTSGECKRLMIFMPPRHGKSELVTVRYAAWRLRQDPRLNIIVGSYNQRLANRFSRKIKNVLHEAAQAGSDDRPSAGVTSHMDSKHEQNPETQRHGVTTGSGSDRVDHQPETRNLKPETQTAPRRVNTAAEWETPEGGGVRAVGAGAGVTGYGAGLVIIDDPVKSRAEAESKTYRDRVWDWFSDDLYTRLEPGASIILIQTRWHEDDLAGRLLSGMEDGGDPWEVISLPALAEQIENGELRIENSDTTIRTSISATVNEKRGAVNTRSSTVPIDARTDETGRGSSILHSSSSILHTPQGANKRPPSPSGASRDRGGPGPLVNSQLSTPDSAGDAAKQQPILNSPFSILHSVDVLGRLPGEALCPERFDVKALERIRRQLGSYSFSALYQQRPVPPEGGLFKRKWFRIVERAPKNLHWKRGYDLAISKKTSADYTASVRCAFDTDGTLYIADGFRARIEYPEQRRYVTMRMAAEPGTEHGIEASLHGQAIVQDLRREAYLRGRAFRAVHVAADKFTRALAWANLAEEGKVVLVRGPWNDAFIDEVASFPTGRHDDQVDAVSLAVQMLNRGKRTIFGF